MVLSLGHSPGFVIVLSQQIGWLSVTARFHSTFHQLVKIKTSRWDRISRGVKTVMTTLWGTAKCFIPLRTLKQSNSVVAAKRPASRGARSLLAALLTFLLSACPISPTFAQSAAQNPPANTAPAPLPAVPASTIAPVSSLGLAKHNFTRGPRAFPTLLKPYRPISIESPELINSPRIDQLIHEDKLALSLQDAVELALENNLDIAIQRYYPWVADASILKTTAVA
jgi:hypothetical protein